MISEKMLQSVCSLNMGGKQCRYLSRAEGTNNYLCLKKTKNKLIIDNVVKDSKNKPDGCPMGDNCSGVEE